MSKFEDKKTSRVSAPRAVALQYDNEHRAPVIIASGMGNVAEKIVDVATQAGVPIYEDNSLATVLSQMELGREIPEELYNAIVEIYIYFLNFDPNDPEKYRRERAERLAGQTAAAQVSAEDPAETEQEVVEDVQ